MAMLIFLSLMFQHDKGINPNPSWLKVPIFIINQTKKLRFRFYFPSVMGNYPYGKALNLSVSAS